MARRGDDVRGDGSAPPRRRGPGCRGDERVEEEPARRARVTLPGVAKRATSGPVSSAIARSSQAQRDRRHAVGVERPHGDLGVGRRDRQRVAQDAARAVAAADQPGDRQRLRRRAPGRPEPAHEPVRRRRGSPASRWLIAWAPPWRSESAFSRPQRGRRAAERVPLDRERAPGEPRRAPAAIRGSTGPSVDRRLSAQCRAHPALRAPPRRAARRSSRQPARRGARR